MIASTFSLAGLIALAAALPSPRTTPYYPPYSEATSFTLVANITEQTIDINLQNYVLSSYHTGAGTGWAVLYPPPTQGRIMYENGTAEEVRASRATISTDGGTPPFPFGLLASSDGSLWINVGAGTPGLQLAPSNPIPKANTDKFSFVACTSTPPLMQGAIRLYAHPAGGATPANCQAVTLLVECSEGAGVEHEFENTVGCYPDVATLKWAL